MTELNAIPDPKRPNVALLIDGENISAAFAGKIIVRAGREGTLVIRRVYGNATRIPAWDDAPGIRLVHTGTGKNAADIALTLEAAELSFDAQIDTFVIVSSDGDFTPLATRLRERGFRVVGLGEEKAPDGFRKTCSEWETLAPKAKAPCKTAQTTTPDSQSLSQSIAQEHVVSGARAQGWERSVASVTKEARSVCFDDAVLEVLRATPNGMTTQEVNIAVRKIMNGRISDQPQKTWPSWFKARPWLYLIDESQKPAVVRYQNSPDKRISACIGKEKKGVLIGQVNPLLTKKANVRVADLTENTWRQYFTARPQSYLVEGTGQETRIRLRKGAAC